MTPSPSMDLDAALSRARMLFSMLSSPQLRAALGARLTGREQIDIADRPTGAEHRNGTRDAAHTRSSSTDAPLDRIDWLRADGQVDAPVPAAPGPPTPGEPGPHQPRGSLNAFARAIIRPWKCAAAGNCAAHTAFTVSRTRVQA